MTSATDNQITELKTLSKLKLAGKLHFWRVEMHAICHEIQAEHEQAIAAALGRGTLTAEDVRSFLNRNSVFDDTTWMHGRQELVFDEDDLQAMADELNATLGRGTCEQILTDCDDGLMPPFTAHCSACGAEWGFTPNYCPNCGAKVVG